MDFRHEGATLIQLCVDFALDIAFLNLPLLDADAPVDLFEERTQGNHPVLDEGDIAVGSLVELEDELARLVPNPREKILKPEVTLYFRLDAEPYQEESADLYGGEEEELA